MSDHPSLFDTLTEPDPPEVCPCCHRPFLSDTGKVGRRHPGTSRDAAVMPGKRSQSVAVLRLLASVGPMNAGTAAGLLGKSANQVATRMLELREAGLAVRQVGDDGQPVTAATPLGGSGIVHEVTVAGRRYLSALG